jgi:hypothetical protein
MPYLPPYSFNILSIEKNFVKGYTLDLMHIANAIEYSRIL